MQETMTATHARHDAEAVADALEKYRRGESLRTCAQHLRCPPGTARSRMVAAAGGPAAWAALNAQRPAPTRSGPTPATDHDVHDAEPVGRTVALEALEPGERFVQDACGIRGRVETQGPGGTTVTIYRGAQERTLTTAWDEEVTFRSRGTERTMWASGTPVRRLG